MVIGAHRCAMQAVLVPVQSARVRHSTQRPRSRSQTPPIAEQVRSEVQGVPGTSGRTSTVGDPVSGVTSIGGEVPASTVGDPVSGVTSIDIEVPASATGGAVGDEHAAIISAATSSGDGAREPHRLIAK